MEEEMDMNENVNVLQRSGPNPPSTSSRKNINANHNNNNSNSDNSSNGEDSDNNDINDNDLNRERISVSEKASDSRDDRNSHANRHDPRGFSARRRSANKNNNHQHKREMTISQGEQRTSIDRGVRQQNINNDNNNMNKFSSRKILSPITEQEQHKEALPMLKMGSMQKRFPSLNMEQQQEDEGEHEHEDAERQDTEEVEESRSHHQDPDRDEAGSGLGVVSSTANAAAPLTNANATTTASAAPPAFGSSARAIMSSILQVLLMRQARQSFQRLLKTTESLLHAVPFFQQHYLNPRKQIQNSSIGDLGACSYPWTGGGYDPCRKMTFFLTCIGTRGDVQPLVILARRLMADGHVCRVACHEEHRGCVEQQGVHFYPLRGFTPNEMMSSPIGGPWSFLRLLSWRNQYAKWYQELGDSTWEAINADLDGKTFSPDAIICSHTQIFALDMAEKFKIPLFLYNVFPITPTSHFRQPSNFFLEGAIGGNPVINWLSFFLFDACIEYCCSRIERKFREKIGLPGLMFGARTLTSHRIASMHIPCFGIWSPHLLSEPDDWHENAVVTGSVNRTGGLGSLPEDLMDYLKYFEVGDRVRIREKPGADWTLSGVVTSNNGKVGNGREYFVKLDLGDDDDDDDDDNQKLTKYMSVDDDDNINNNNPDHIYGFGRGQLDHFSGKEKEKPIFIGFGVSMTNEHTLKRVWTEVQKTVGILGLKRVIFHVNKDHDARFIDDRYYSGIKHLSNDRVFVLDRPVPHDLLFGFCYKNVLTIF